MCGVQINETSLWVKIRSFVSCVSFAFFLSFFSMLLPADIQPDVGTSYLSKILLLYGAKTNKTLV